MEVGRRRIHFSLALCSLLAVVSMDLRSRPRTSSSSFVTTTSDSSAALNNVATAVSQNYEAGPPELQDQTVSSSWGESYTEEQTGVESYVGASPPTVPSLGRDPFFMQFQEKEESSGRTREQIAVSVGADFYEPTVVAKATVSRADFYEPTVVAKATVSGADFYEPTTVVAKATVVAGENNLRRSRSTGGQSSPKTISGVQHTKKTSSTAETSTLTPAETSIATRPAALVYPAETTRTTAPAETTTTTNTPPWRPPCGTAETPCGQQNKRKPPVWTSTGLAIWTARKLKPTAATYDDENLNKLRRKREAPHAEAGGAGAGGAGAGAPLSAGARAGAPAESGARGKGFLCGLSVISVLLWWTTTMGRFCFCFL